MPGITGIIGVGSAEGNEHRLRQMITCMMHESFYKSGQHINEELESWVGWVGFKDSFTDCMPLWNESRDICMLFSGENYIDPEQIANLKSKGHEFESGNASYLVHYYEDLGADFFRKLNGRFCGVILDYRHQSTILFNDRYGLNRIYYHEKEGALFFSSEAKSLLTILPELRQLDLEGLAETFSFGCVLQNKTLYTGISLLPAGSVWSFYSGQETRRSLYFRPEELERLEALSPSEYYKKIKETWIRILPRYLHASERVALSLTGGKDSRMILAWAQSSPGTLPCYTFGGTYRDCFDIKIARRVADTCKQPYQVIRLDESFFKEFSHLAERTVFLTDGNMDVSGSPGLFGNRLARQVAPIRLTGNYGQEILRSDIAFKPTRIFREILESEFARRVDSATQLYYDELCSNQLSFVAFKQVPWHHYARLASELSQVTMRSPYLDNEILEFAFRAPAETALSEDIQLRLIAEGNAELGRIGTDRGLRYKPIPLYTSLEHQFQEFIFKAEYAYDYGMPQFLVKVDNYFRKLHLERLFLGRHKYYHFRIWYRDKLSGYVKEVLLDSRTRNRPFLKGRNIEKMVNAHIKGIGNYTSEIHRLLTAELTYRHLIERRG
jgi:asparagine synthase (glutamine-hydrolysing)